jgi:hypothetical protein
MELTAYLHAGWEPLIRPAPATRPWMDATSNAFAYRCLPLNIANAHGWELLNPHGFEAVWDGGEGADAVTFRNDPGAPALTAPASIFGYGVLTFHVYAIFRTPPGWNLWIGGSPNRQKDGVAPLTGVVETDWSPYTFTMNWRFTRPGHPVRFEAMEPFGFVFPVQRALLERFAPAFALSSTDPETEARFLAWSAARDAFQEKIQVERPTAPSASWQKHYYRGVDLNERPLVDDHQAKLRLKPFDRTAAPETPVAPADDPPSPPPSTTLTPADQIAALKRTLAHREWLLESLELQRDLAPAIVGIEQRTNLSADEFLERYYAPGRPVILTGEMADWPALRLWTPAYLKTRIGGAVVEFQGGRLSNPNFELEKPKHRRIAPFDAFIDRVLAAAPSNDDYLTPYSAEANRAALAPLAADMGRLDRFLTRDHPCPDGSLWIGPQGVFSPLQQAIENRFVAQIVGRKHVRLAPAAETGKLYPLAQGVSAVHDLDDPTLSMRRFPRLAGAHVYDVLLDPGDILFVPFGWWRQARALDFSVTATYANFQWPNDAAATYPMG